MDTFTLDQNIRDLTEFAPAAIRRDNGTIDRVVAPPLLAQLRAAASNSSTQAPGGGSSEKTKIPVDAGAVDLLDRITKHARVCATETPAPHLPPCPEALGVVDAVKRYGTAVRAHTQGWIDRAAEITGSWCADIRAHLDPAKRFPLKGKCPECGISKVADMTTGELVRSDVLHVYPGDESRHSLARCHYCGAEWRGELALQRLSAFIKEG
jgi:hypothetical protein